MCLLSYFCIFWIKATFLILEQTTTKGTWRDFCISDHWSVFWLYRVSDSSDWCLPCITVGWKSWSVIVCRAMATFLWFANLWPATNPFYWPFDWPRGNVLFYFLSNLVTERHSGLNGSNCYEQTIHDCELSVTSSELGHRGLKPDKARCGWALDMIFSRFASLSVLLRPIGPRVARTDEIGGLHDIFSLLTLFAFGLGSSRNTFSLICHYSMTV